MINFRINVNNIENGNNLFFIDGPGGTGKTFLYSAILNTVRSKGKIALAVASSGIAALLLDNGRTAHSRFKIPINLDDLSTCNIAPNSELAELIRMTQVVIWDEAPMMHKHAFEALDRTFRDILKVDLPFGNKVLIFGGDFRQILPVIRKGTRNDIVESCLKRSYLWEFVCQLRLTINMRVKNSNLENFEEQQFFERLLLDIGNGSILSNDDYITLPEKLFHQNNNIDNFLKTFYDDFKELGISKDLTFERAILSSTTEHCNLINNKLIEKFPGETCEFLSSDSVDDQLQADLYPTEFLNTIEVSGLPPHRLLIKSNSNSYKTKCIVSFN